MGLLFFSLSGSLHNFFPTVGFSAPLFHWSEECSSFMIKPPPHPTALRPVQSCQIQITCDLNGIQTPFPGEEELLQ